MRKSFIEYVTGLGRWGWVVLVQIISGITGAYLNVSGTWGFPTWLWVTLLGIAFIIVPFIAFHKLRIKRDGLQKELDDIENARPKITVEPKVYYGDKAILEIHNNGAVATFTAIARVIKGNIEPNLFSLYWQSHPNDATCPINKGDTQTILVAEISPDTELNDEPRTTIFKGGIALYQLGGKRIGVCDYSVVQDAKLKNRYPTMYEGKSELKDKCEIEVTITSDPQLSQPFEGQKYLIEIDHEHGDKLSFIYLPESIPDNEGSQTQ